jgi:hypothetical protein
VHPAFCHETNFLIGEKLFSIMQHVTKFEIRPKTDSQWTMIQGPILGIGCKMLVHKSPESISGILVGASRGYGQSLADGFLKEASNSAWSRPVRGLHQMVATVWPRRLPNKLDI